jgi:hypothetical protein
MENIGFWKVKDDWSENYEKCEKSHVPTFRSILYNKFIFHATNPQQKNLRYFLLQIKNAENFCLLNLETKKKEKSHNTRKMAAKAFHQKEEKN